MLEDAENKQIDLHTHNHKKNSHTKNNLSHIYTNMYINNNT